MVVRCRIICEVRAPISTETSSPAGIVPRSQTTVPEPAGSSSQRSVAPTKVVLTGNVSTISTL